MSSMNTLETLVRDFYQQYRARNREAVESMMHADFTFTSPYDDGIDRTEYFARCWIPGDHMTDLAIEHIAVVGQVVFLQYLARWDNARSWRNVEVFTIEDDKVRSVAVYFGDPMQKDAQTKGSRSVA